MYNIFSYILVQKSNSIFLCLRWVEEEGDGGGAGGVPGGRHLAY